MSLEPDAPRLPAEREALAATPSGTWIVLVQDGIVQQAFPATNVEEALHKLMDRLPAVQIYAVKDGQTPPAPGAHVDPLTLGWTLMADPGPARAP